MKYNIFQKGLPRLIFLNVLLTEIWNIIFKMIFTI